MWECFFIAKLLFSRDIHIDPLALYSLPLSVFGEAQIIAETLTDEELLKTIEARAKARAMHERLRELDNG